MRRSMPIAFALLLTAATLAAPLPAAADVLISPMTPYGGQVPVGSTTVIGSVSITNAPFGPMETITVTSLAFVGPDAADFAIDSDGCTGVPLNVWSPSGSSCPVSIAFTPSRPDLEAAELAVAFVGTSSGSGSQAIPVQAMGGPIGALCGFASFPKAAVFQAAYVGRTSQLAEFDRLSIANCGNADLNITDVTLAGPDAADFVLGPRTCVGTYPPTDTPWWQSCFVDLTFAPTSAGSKEATVTVVSDGARSPQVLTVTGLGLAAADLGVTLAAEPEPLPPVRGGIVRYSMTVENLGPSKADGAYIGWSFAYPGTLEVGPAAATCGPLGWAPGISCVIQLGDLAVGAVATRTVEVRIGDSGVPGSLWSVASIGSSVADLGYGNNMVSTSIPIEDTEAPTIEFSGNASPYALDAWVSIWCMARDNVEIDWSRTSCSATSGPAYEFAPEPVEVTATAFDIAGHQTDASTTIEVDVDYVGMEHLTRLWVWNPDVIDDLCGILVAASASEVRGRDTSEAGQLGAYRALLRAQAGKAIGAEDAATLIRLSYGL